MVLLLISVSCESEMGIGNQDLNYQLDMSLQSAERYRVVMAVTDIAIGDNRLAFAIIGKDGPLIMDRINKHFYKSSPEAIEKEFKIKLNYNQIESILIGNMILQLKT